jgi:hypothetical protein
MKQETATLLASITVTLKELQLIQQDLNRITELKTLLLQREYARIDFNKRAIV